MKLLSSASGLMYLVRGVRENAGPFSLLLLLQLVCRLPSFAFPWVWKWILDILTERRTFAELAWSGAAFGGLFALQSMGAHGAFWAEQELGERCAVRLRSRVWRSASSSGETGDNGSLQHLLLGDVAHYAGMLYGVLPALIASSFVSVLILVSIFVLSPGVFLVVTLGVPLALVPSYWLRRRFRELSEQAEQGEIGLAVAVRESLSGRQQLRAAHASSWWHGRFLQPAFRERFLAMRGQRTACTAAACWDSACHLLLTAGVIVVAGHGVLNGVLTLGSWLAAGELWLGLHREGRAIPPTLRALHLSHAPLARLDEAVGAASVREDEEATEDFELPRDGECVLELDGVRFGWTDSVLFEGSLRVHAGELAIIAGPTGCGKTTLFRLLDRSATPRAGTIRLRGVALADWKPGALFSQAAFLHQEPFLFSGTIDENLLLGRQETPGLQRLLQSVSLSALAGRLASGFRFGEGGSPLSTGERRRLALVRTLARPAALYVLDEPFAGVDSATAGRCMELIRNVCRQGSAVLCITHDVLTREAADTVHEIHEGALLKVHPKPTAESQSIAAKNELVNA